MADQAATAIILLVAKLEPARPAPPDEVLS
jgi:hypothetical protein